ncbi:hypothetical protein MLD38_020234 [Melastoma candidum]|uniref:Uncharacterized protein n=1 Tax=Melastoma candidum TaxID=119954 RepID=A0ACB9QBS2_9MYRT|nr:hypothetical protein MLD38_020234 [Melastoma candidum]
MSTEGREGAVTLPEKPGSKVNSVVSTVADSEVLADAPLITVAEDGLGSQEEDGLGMTKERAGSIKCAVRDGIGGRTSKKDEIEEKKRNHLQKC